MSIITGLAHKKKGYSGVAILSKTEPNHIEFGTGIDYMDFEGRNLRVDFNSVSIMSIVFTFWKLIWTDWNLS